MSRQDSNIKGFLGAAGTGKTFQIFEEIKRIEKKQELKDHQALLALTFMHGARRRLEEKLGSDTKIGIKYECKTIDSFALYIVNNFRIYLDENLNLPVIPSFKIERNYEFDERKSNVLAKIDQIRLWALEILGNKSVKKSIYNAYPIIIIDEFQDCDQNLLPLIKELASSNKLILAADEFQYLNIPDKCKSVTWLKDNGEFEILTKNHRTKNYQLLNTALALREGKKYKDCIDVKGVDGPGLAAWEIYFKLYYKKWWVNGSSVLLTPASPEKSDFVNNVLNSSQKKLGKKKKIGPYPFKWRDEKSKMEKRIIKEIPSSILKKDRILLEEFDKIKVADNDGIMNRVIHRAQDLCKIRGEGSIFKSEFLNILSKKIHNHFSYRYSQYQGYQAMTIHSAKNREFENVFILWPYEIQSNYNYQRKLMYNAVTRAKFNSVILVQGGSDRIEEDQLLQLIT